MAEDMHDLHDRLSELVSTIKQELTELEESKKIYSADIESIEKLINKLYDIKVDMEDLEGKDEEEDEHS